MVEIGEAVVIGAIDGDSGGDRRGERKIETEIGTESVSQEKEGIFE